VAQVAEAGIDRWLLDELASIASRAAAAILSIGPHEVSRREKSDGSPVTAADEAAEAVILRGLEKLMPTVPVISEEASARGVKTVPGSRFVLVDPLDGTREFLAGLDEYTVNIAVIENGRPAAGVVAAPKLGTVWAGIVGAGAERLILSPGAEAAAASQRTTIHTRKRPPHDAIALISRSHREAETEAYLDRLTPLQRVICGSSLKFCRIAEGAADLYVRMASLSEWDVAAGNALLVAAGGAVRDAEWRPLTYGHASLRLPPFIASGEPVVVSAG
jgi:3'(2'), 5'-bisphosphate nucleotidase